MQKTPTLLTIAALSAVLGSSCIRLGLGIAPWAEEEDSGNDGSADSQVQDGDADADSDVDTDIYERDSAVDGEGVDGDDAGPTDAGWGDAVWVYFASGDGLDDSLNRGPRGSCTSCPEQVDTSSGLAWSFDGTDAVDITDDGTIDWSAGFTVSVHAFLRETSDFRCFFMKIFGTGFLNTFKLAVRPDFDFETSQSGSVNRMRTGVLPSIDDWMHLAITWDGTTKRLYVDGEEVDSEASSGVDSDDGPIVAGSDRDSGDGKEWLDGLLRDLRFYDHALSAAEVDDLAN